MTTEERRREIARVEKILRETRSPHLLRDMTKYLRRLKYESNPSPKGHHAERRNLKKYE